MTRRRNKGADRRRAAGALLASAAMLLAGLHGTGTRAADLGRHLAWPLLQLMGTIALGTCQRKIRMMIETTMISSISFPLSVSMERSMRSERS